MSPLDNFCIMKLRQVAEFQTKVKNNGCKLLKDILNDEWFDDLRRNDQKLWLDESGRTRYHGKLFPFRWLCGEKQWDFINLGLTKLADLTKKKKVLREKLRRVVLNDWNENIASAFEISALCKFVNDRVFVDLEPNIGPNCNTRCDVLVKIDARDILVELTAITKDLIEKPLGGNVMINLSVDKMKGQIIKKIKEKYENQLLFADKPAILIISLPPVIGSTQLTARWAVNSCLESYPKISSIIISDSYLFSHGANYFNDKAEFQLNSAERVYISRLMKKVIIY